MILRSRHGIRLLPILVYLFSASSLAQDEASTVDVVTEDALDLQKIQVTGSRIRRTDVETSQPVMVINREAIDSTGLVSIGDILQELPITGSALNTLVNNWGDGSTLVDLRNLGADRTLVLVNGRRWPKVGGLYSAVALNTIPVSVVERIEILKDGASAIYGSDAIAGVINIITQRDYRGVELEGQVGEFDEGDGTTTYGALRFGGDIGQTNAFVDISYYDHDKVMAGDRDISEVPVYGTGVTRGSTTPPQGRFRVVDPAGNADECSDAGDFLDFLGGCYYDITLPDGASQPAGFDDFRRFNNPDDRYNYAPVNYLWTPSERVNVLGQVSFPVSDTITGMVEGYYHDRNSEQQLAYNPWILGFGQGGVRSPTISASNPYNPFGVDLVDFYLHEPGPEQAAYLGLQRRMVEAGPRQYEEDVDLWRGAVSFEGSFPALGRYFDWDVALVRSEWDQNLDISGFSDFERLARALGPVDECVGAGDGCVPFNLFGGLGPDGNGTITPEQVGYITFSVNWYYEYESTDFLANVSTELIDLPAGPLAFATGYEFRDEEVKQDPDENVESGRWGSDVWLGIDNQQDIHEVYGELIIPVLADLPAAQTLEVNIAARYSDYSTYGDTTTGKVGVKWKPIDDLLIRGSIGEGFRAPALEDTLIPVENPYYGRDPCADFFNTGVSQTVIDNCIAHGVPADGSYGVTDFDAEAAVLVVTNNEDLKPEKSDNYTLGLVYTPTWVRDLAVYLDWYRIELDDAISNIDEVEFCYNSSSRAFCDLIERADSGALTRVESMPVNLGSEQVEGIDFTILYTAPATRIGEFGLNWSSAYVIEQERTVVGPEGEETINLVGTNEGDFAYPRWKSNLNINWNYGQWGANWGMRYIHHMEEDCADFLDGTPDSLSALGLCSSPNQNPDGSWITDENGEIVEASNKLGSVTYHDVQVTYDLKRYDVRITAGVNNVGDKDPPLCFSCYANTFDGSIYEVPGRFPYLRVRVKF